MKNVTKICPECRGENVQEPLVVWHNANGDREMVDDGCFALASGYGFFCEDCDDAIDHLIKKEEKKKWAADRLFAMGLDDEEEENQEGGKP